MHFVSRIAVCSQFYSDDEGITIKENENRRSLQKNTQLKQKYKQLSQDFDHILIYCERIYNIFLCASILVNSILSQTFI